ncbi:MAG: DUF87 domain-containing protein [Theionarchaea archaeon]|nr:DUF87 domain-containing protein [Theionarchaea archaeon]
MFESEHEGKLYDLQEINGKFIAILRFNYNMDIMEDVLEGDFIACENFLSTRERKRYTLMKITSIFPKHYALEAIKRGGYPTFLKEVVRNVVEDWETDTSTETFVLATASPVGYDLTVEGEEMGFQKGISKPMPGKDIGILNHDTIREFLCWGIGERIEVGRFRRDIELEVFVNLRRMLRRHFGVFGSTGTGKSNFLAQLMRTILGHDNNIKIVLFDIQGEYPALLADVLQNCGIIFFSEGEITDNLRRHIVLGESSNERNTLIDEIAHELSQTSKKPGPFENSPNPFVPFFRTLLEENRIRILRPVIESGLRYVQDFVDSLENDLSGQWGSHLRDRIQVEINQRGIGGELTEENVAQLQRIVRELRDQKPFKGKEGLQYYAELPFSIVETRLISIMQSLRSTTGRTQTSIEGVVEDFIINEEDERLCLISISDEREMRSVLSTIVERAISYRKRNPTFFHDVLFIFDEAHEYVPAGGTEEARQEGVKSSRKALMKLSRQGRKYGLGMCLATQRTTYLDTIIMGQVHTFFAGFLPRKVDRERIGEAFNIDEATLIEVQEFNPGEWLLSSAVATGLINVPELSNNSPHEE